MSITDFKKVLFCREFIGAMFILRVGCRERTFPDDIKTSKADLMILYQH